MHPDLSMLLDITKEVLYMVKGISRQVILVRNPDPKLFEQAIFLLKEDAVNQGVSDAQLLKEASRLMCTPGRDVPCGFLSKGPVWAILGAAVTGMLWLLTACVF